MREARVTKAELLTAWRDAVRAAELAERLATNAVEAAEQAEFRADVAAEIADLAEQAATSAERAAARARAVATESAALAKSLRADSVPKAHGTVAATKQVEEDARAAYHGDRQKPPARDRDR